LEKGEGNLQNHGLQLSGRLRTFLFERKPRGGHRNVDGHVALAPSEKYRIYKGRKKRLRGLAERKLTCTDQARLASDRRLDIWAQGKW